MSLIICCLFVFFIFCINNIQDLMFFIGASSFIFYFFFDIKEINIKCHLLLFNAQIYFYFMYFYLSLTIVGFLW